jgi:hypothetical protein
VHSDLVGLPGSRAGQTRPPQPYLRWPPPGLERQHGALWPVIVGLAAGSTLLVLPQLLMLTDTTTPATRGPFASTWLLAGAVSLVGLLLVLGGCFRLATLLRAGSRTVVRGYGWLTYAQVVTDLTRDTGFVLQGARHFARLDEATRRRVLVMRLCAPFFYLCAGLWPLVAFPVMLALASRGAASLSALWLVSVAPLAALLVTGLICRAVEYSDLTPARRSAEARAENELALSSEIDEWNMRLEDEGDAGALPPGAPAARVLGFASVLPLLIGAFALLPILGLTTLGAIGPLVTGIAVPNYTVALGQIRTLDVLHPYYVEADPAVTPRAAGEALHALTFIGAQPRWNDASVRAPARSYADRATPPTIGDRAALHGLTWDRGLLALAMLGLSDEQHAALSGLAAEPYQTEIRLLARAAAADIGAARWVSPLPVDVPAIEWHTPRFYRMRDAIHTRFAVAALAVADGRHDDAELAIREVLSVGLLLADNGVTVIDGLIGASIAYTAAGLLGELYAITGRLAEAERIAGTLAAVEVARAATRLGAVGGADAREMTRFVAAAELPRPVRWDAFAAFITIDGCLGAGRVIFGRSPDHEQWLAKVRAELVRYPADAERFDHLVAYGQFGRQVAPRRTALERVLTASIGRPAGVQGCSEIIAGWQR